MNSARPAFPIPAEIDPPGRRHFCIPIPDHPDHLRVFAGLFHQLAEYRHWEREETKSGTLVAQVYKAIYDEINWEGDDCMGCCHEEVLHRMTEDGGLEISTDGGETWIPDPDDPRRTGTQLPNTIPGTGEGKKCNAASNAIDNFKDAQAAFGHDLSTATTLIGLAAALAVEVALLLFTVGTAAEILIPLMISTATALFGLAESAYNAEFTEAVWDDLICCLFCTVGSDGQFNTTQYNDLLACVDETFSGNVALTFNAIITGWGIVGLNNACIAGVATAADCSECNCNEDCIAEDFIIHGTLVGIGSNYIDVAPESVTYNGIPALWVVYGSLDDSYCCHFCSYIITEGDIASASVITCEGTAHGNTETDMRRVEMYGVSSYVVRIVIMPDGCA